MKYLICCLFLSITLVGFGEEANIKTLPSSPSSIAIDAKSRAQDLKETFELFKKEKTGPKVNVQLSNQSSISNIVDFSIAQNGTIIILRTNTMQGIKYVMVNVEDIVSIVIP